MNGLEAVAKKLKKKQKITYDDYEVVPPNEKNEVEPKIEVEQKVHAEGESNTTPSIKDLKRKKFRTSLNLPEAEHRMLNEMYAGRILNDEKIDRSTLICQAIQLLYDYEHLKE